MHLHSPYIRFYIRFYTRMYVHVYAYRSIVMKHVVIILCKKSQIVSCMSWK